jgi:5-methyltetrahydrofolate--homocysteine methyltransferase
MTVNILDYIAERVLVIDGAMGTMIQGADLTLEDFAGHENCSEILLETRPDFVRKVHEAYLEAGAGAVETNTFGANQIVLAEFGLSAKTYELNRIGARLARECCERYTTPSEPRFVIGSVGPGTKLPTLGHTDFDTIAGSYAEQVRGLIDGGADAVLIETCQDILQAKAAIAGARRAFADRGRKLPLFCQVTMETTGTMLVGTDIAAALTAIEPFAEVDVFGLNCATGPQEMSEHVAYLGKYSPKPVSVVPNAGLPQLVGGCTHYPLTPKELASWLVRFIEEDGVSIVGGCCGTTPEHIREVVKAVGKRVPKRREPRFAPSLSSLYSAVPVVQDASYLIIGERTNVLGSKKFKDAFNAGDLDGMVAVAKDQVREGCHLIDVCADQTGRDARADLIPILKAMATQVAVPICVDSNSWSTFAPALKLLGGRSLVNSLNLENGEEDLLEHLALVRDFGAAAILGTIDEDKQAGMAKTAERKVAIARRLFAIATGKAGLRPQDIFYDPLVLPISTGQEEDRRNAVETIEGIRRIKQEVPGTFSAIGLSNVSFGLNPAARHVLNSVFLHYCREAGLDAAIVHAAKIIPLYKIDAREREVAEDLVFDRRRPGYDPLLEFVKLFEGRKAGATARKEPPKTIEEKLKLRIIDGDRIGLETDLDLALKTYPPLDIINRFLLDGMKVVGELFGSGQMQLPFVLQSAETMKAAVSHLEPFMEKVEGDSKGKIVLATVKGDVHDIGKNLVDIILTNNGYTVFNLGIKVPITAIIEEARKHEAHAIGLSGLLVKSTVVMKENLDELERQKVGLPVILGGAALTRRYVEIDCRRDRTGRVEYAKDAFEGLSLMDSVMKAEPERASRYPGGRGYAGQGLEAAAAGEPAGASVDAGSAGPAAPPSRFDRPVEEAPERPLPDRSQVRRDVPVPKPPFLGARVVERIALDALLPYLNENVLFKFQWQFKQKKMAKDEYARFIEREVRPILRDLVRRAKEEDLLQPRAVYGYYECQSEGDDVIVYRPGGGVLHRFRFPRQKKHQRLCIADFFRPVSSGEKDLIAFTVVTVGAKASEVERRWFAENRYRDYLYLHGLSVEAAEALAEFIHRQVRVELEIAGDDSREIEGLFRQGYRGSRYSFGYPACPNLEDQAPLLEILDARRIGVTLSDEFMLEPEQSTSALVVHHPQAKYFNA